MKSNYKRKLGKKTVKTITIMTNKTNNIKNNY